MEHIIKMFNMETIITIATVAIFFCAFASYRLASKIQERDEEHRQQISDLYQAIVISNLISSLAGPDLSNLSLIENMIREFNKKYKGKTPIFD